MIKVLARIRLKMALVLSDVSKVDLAQTKGAKKDLRSGMESITA